MSRCILLSGAKPLALLWVLQQSSRVPAKSIELYLDLRSKLKNISKCILLSRAKPFLVTSLSSNGEIFERTFGESWMRLGEKFVKAIHCTRRSVAVIPVAKGGALMSHVFELDSKVWALFYGAPLVITFHVPTKAALQEACSTPILALDILADKPTEKKFDLALWLAATKFSQAKRLLVQYGSLVSVISIVTLFIYLLASPSSGNANGGKKKR